MQKEILIAKRNVLAILLKEAYDHGEDATHIITQMGEIGDKIKEMDEYGE